MCGIDRLIRCHKTNHKPGAVVRLLHVRLASCDFEQLIGSTDYGGGFGPTVLRDGSSRLRLGLSVHCTIMYYAQQNVFSLWHGPFFTNPLGF